MDALFRHEADLFELGSSPFVRRLGHFEVGGFAEPHFFDRGFDRGGGIVAAFGKNRLVDYRDVLGFGVLEKLVKAFLKLVFALARSLGDLFGEVRGVENIVEFVAGEGDRLIFLFVEEAACARRLFLAAFGNRRGDRFVSEVLQLGLERYEFAAYR